MKNMFEIPNKHIFCKNYHNSKHSWVAFLHFKGLVNEGQILKFYNHFIYKNFVMNFKLSEFVGFAR